jgi:septal ring factor EnvC (AmiA/AmiB activator)
LTDQIKQLKTSNAQLEKEQQELEETRTQMEEQIKEKAATIETLNSDKSQVCLPSPRFLFSARLFILSLPISLSSLSIYLTI